MDVKAGDKVNTISFSGKKGKMHTAETSMLIPPGTKQLKFVVRTNEGRGKRGLPVRWRPGSTHVVKIRVTGNVNHIEIIQ